MNYLSENLKIKLFQIGQDGLNSKLSLISLAKTFNNCAGGLKSNFNNYLRFYVSKPTLNLFLMPCLTIKN